MFRIRYNLETGLLTGWSKQNDLSARHGEAVIQLDLPKPDVDDYEYFLFDITTQTLIDNPAKRPPEPPRSTHLSVLEAVDTAKARPARIKRVWGGRDYFYDCFATESVKDQYVAGDIAVGDYVIVHFDDIGEQIVTAKVFKSW